MANIISVVLRKGGSGKTTTSINLAGALLLLGKRVLLIDLDAQANATISVGVNPLNLQSTINDLFTNIEMLPKDAIIKTKFGLDLLPSSEELSKTEAGMTAMQVGSLKPIIAALSDDYDYIIIDTPPSSTYLIPLQTHYLAMQGLSQIMEDIRQVKNGLNPDLHIIGILPTMVNANTNIAKTVLDQVQASYADLLLPFEIKWSIKHSEASLVGKPIVIYAPEHKGAVEHLNLATYIDGKEFIG